MARSGEGRPRGGAAQGGGGRGGRERRGGQGGTARAEEGTG